MSAPTLGGDFPLGTAWAQRLLALQAGWDSYGGRQISEKALLTVGQFAVVPCSGGGVQLEIHRDGLDIEIEIKADGTISGVLVGRA